MSLDVTGFITWIRTFLDDVYAEKGSSGTDLELNLIPKSQNPNGVVCISGGNVNYDLDKVYPIGSIYMSVNSTNPSTLFGGTWVQLTDTFLYATSTTSDANVTTAPTGQGEATHTLTTDEMPSHTHTQNAHSHSTGNSTNKYFITSSVNTVYITENQKSQTNGSNGYNIYTSTQGSLGKYTATQSVTATNQNKGGGQAHNNMPPYMKVFMWKRTA